MTDRASELGRYGADSVILADDLSLALFHPDYYRQIALQAIKKLNPSIVLAAATSSGKDLAPRLAIHLDTAVASECTQLELENGKLVATRPAFAGKVLLRVKVNSSPSIATLRQMFSQPKKSSHQRNRRSSKYSSTDQILRWL